MSPVILLTETLREQPNRTHPTVPSIHRSEEEVARGPLVSALPTREVTKRQRQFITVVLLRGRSLWEEQTPVRVVCTLLGLRARRIGELLAKGSRVVSPRVYVLPKFI